MNRGPLWKEGGFSESRLSQNKSMEEQEFLSVLGALRELPDEAWWVECFSRDAMTRTWSRDKMLSLGQTASEQGRTLGESFRPELKEKGLDGLYAASGLSVQELCFQDPPGLSLFALYESPDKVYIKSALLEDCDRYVHTPELASILGSFSCRETFLAHEYYHHQEYLRPEELFSASYREPRGLFRSPVPAAPLGEIGAMSFAKALLALPWSPFLLDCVALARERPGSARELGIRMMARTGLYDENRNMEKKP